MNGIRVTMEYGQHGVNERIEEMLAGLVLDRSNDIVEPVRTET